jgi:streptogramin lyase
MKKLAIALIATLLTSCGGGGGGPALPSAPGKPSSSATKPVKVALVVPSGSPASSLRPRRPAFISPSAQGATIAVSGSQGGTGSAVVDLSSGSSACTTTASQRTCSATVVVPVDTDTFTVTLYDTAPVNGAIPASAHVLGIGVVTQVITAAFSGSLPIIVGGEVSSIGVAAPYVSVPADGSTHSVGIAISPTDFGNNPLTGASPVPYANPIAVALTETGGTTMTLMLDGAPAAGNTATLKSSSDTVSVSYSGAGSPGDTADVVLSATGATSESTTISPLFITGEAQFWGNDTLSLNGAATAIPLTTSEANAPASISLTQTSSGCTNVATVAQEAVQVGQTPPPGTVTYVVTGGSAASGGGCTVTINDTITSYTFDVVNTPVGGTIPLPGESIQSYKFSSTAPLVSPAAVIGGPDGRLWVSDTNNGGVVAVTTSGVVTTYNAAGNLYGSSGLAVGSDGYIYGADSGQGSIDKINTSGAIQSYTHTTYAPVAAIGAADGNVWVTEGNGSAGEVASLSPAGALSEYSVNTEPSAVPAGITSGPTGSGTLWMCVNSPLGAAVDSVTTGSGSGAGVVASVVALPNACGDIAMQSDGKAAWVTSGTTALYRVDTTTLAVSTVTLSQTMTSVAAGADNAIYVTEGSGVNDYVARIGNGAAAPYTPNEMPLTVSGATPTGIGVGADGRMWFGENNTNQIGALSP